ncbi:FMN-binding protein [Stieleria magnilauensis]
MDGTKLTGQIIQIRKADKEVDFNASVNGQPTESTYRYEQIHAATYRGKRFVITAKDSSGSSPEKKSTTDGRNTRTKAEVNELIQTVGKTPPAWYESTPLSHPKTLDLDWPLKASGRWNESKNVGQYIWGRVNPNPSRWRSGLKLVHECTKLHQGNRTLLERDMEMLGKLYFTLLQDYERAAYWLERSQAGLNTEAGIYLASCYWRLGNRDMALSLMRGKSLHIDAIKLLGDMGELDGALIVARVYEKTSLANEAWLNTGDALRGAGRFDDAIRSYQKVITRNKARNEEYRKRYVGRARDAITAINLFDKADVSKVADGTYIDSSTGYNGVIQVRVVVNDSKIEDVKVVKHREKQFYAALTDTPQQIIDSQGVQEIDGTSGATITSQAIISAAAKALAQGAR